MALGFGFNKTKVLASAEKYVQQGKLQNAITEYEKVVKEDPKDLTVLNTIGDLYARIGQTEQAVNYFKRVGDSYGGEGFTVKAIAMYKKLTKLAPGNTDCILKLAELYTQQGLYNDARSQYVLIADQHMKSGHTEDAVKIFQKMLELDPENAAMQSKLADLYVKLGRKTEARDIFFTAAQSLFARGALDQADEALGKVVNLDPQNADALMLRGQIAVDSGDPTRAAGYLEKIPNLDSRPEALRALLKSYVALGRTADGEPIAGKLLSVHNDVTGMTSYAEALLGKGEFEAALRVYDTHADKLLAANQQGLLEALHGAIGRIKDSAPALSALRSLYLKAGDTSHLTEVTELLAHAYVAGNELEKGRDLYQELSQMEPENPLHMQNYRQIVARLGQDAAARPLTPEEGAQAFMVDELEISAPAVPQDYTPELAEAIKAALTESELMDTYNMPAKAVGPLEAVLPQAPNDVTLNQRLASLYARAERFAEAAKCCDVLQQVYSVAGHSKEAHQYLEMGDKYRQQAAAAPQPTAAAVEMEAPAPPPAMAAEAPAAAPEFSMEVQPPPAAEIPVEPPPAAHEIDLSGEWESMTTTEAPAAAPPPPAAPPEPAGPSLADLMEEVKFYLSQSMFDEARSGLEKCESMSPGAPGLAELRALLEAGVAAADTQKIEVPPEPAPAAAEESVQALVFDEASLGAAEPAAPVAEVPVMQEAAPEPPPPPAPKPVAPPPPPPPPPQAAPAPAAASADVLGDFVLDLEESLGDDFAIGGAKAPAKPAAAPPPPAAAKPAPPPPPPPPPAPVAAPAMSAAAPAAAAAAAPAATVTLDHHEAKSALADIFDEFKEDVEETQGEPEDPDTHYNLGVAFKEMGLMDEAIGELQKVCQAIDHGHPFGQVMQAYTWLAHCFVEKGVPQAAIKWYEKALKVPNADEESKLAVYYEMGNAQEAAGNKDAALKAFMEVYGSNIDYRDVAERIKTLKS